MATHSSMLTWRIPWTEGLGGLQSMGSQRVRHDGVTNAFLTRTVVGSSKCDVAYFSRLGKPGPEWRKSAELWAVQVGNACSSGATYLPIQPQAPTHLASPATPFPALEHAESFKINRGMEFRKMLMITLYAKQKKRHRCVEQSFRLCGRRRGWDISREQHRNMYNI